MSEVPHPCIMHIPKPHYMNISHRNLIPFGCRFCRSSWELDFCPFYVSVTCTCTPNTEDTHLSFHLLYTYRKALWNILWMVEFPACWRKDVLPAYRLVIWTILTAVHVQQSIKNKAFHPPCLKLLQGDLWILYSRHSYQIKAARKPTEVAATAEYPGPSLFLTPF